MGVMDGRPPLDSMTLPEAMAELRSQMNLPASINRMADFVHLGGPGSGDADRTHYQLMRTTAQTMASMMAQQEPKVLGEAGSPAVDVNRFRTMMGSINEQLPQVVAAMPGGPQQNPTKMEEIAAFVSARVAAAAPTVAGGPFRNMSSSFPPMMGVRFWNMSGHPVPNLGKNDRVKGTPAGGMM